MRKEFWETAQPNTTSLTIAFAPKGERVLRALSASGPGILSLLALYMLYPLYTGESFLRFGYVLLCPLCLYIWSAVVKNSLYQGSHITFDKSSGTVKQLIVSLLGKRERTIAAFEDLLTIGIQTQIHSLKDDKNPEGPRKIVYRKKFAFLILKDGTFLQISNDWTDNGFKWDKEQIHKQIKDVADFIGIPASIPSDLQPIMEWKEDADGTTDSLQWFSEQEIAARKKKMWKNINRMAISTVLGMALGIGWLAALPENATTPSSHHYLIIDGAILMAIVEWFVDALKG